MTEAERATRIKSTAPWLAAVTGCVTLVTAWMFFGAVAIILAGPLIIASIIVGMWQQIGKGLMWFGAIFVSAWVLPYAVALQFDPRPVDETSLAVRVIAVIATILIIWLDFLMVSDAIERRRMRSRSLDSSSHNRS